MDLSQLLALLASVDPKAAAIGAFVLFLAQRLATSERGKALLDKLRKLLGQPVASAVPAPVAPKSATDEAHETLLDILAEQLRKRLAAKGDAEKAVAEFGRVVAHLDKPDKPVDAPVVK